MSWTASAFDRVLWEIGFSICAQRPERSFWYDGHQLPMDARMTGIFLGFLIVSVYLLAMRRWSNGGLPDRWVLAAATVGALAMAFDGLTSYGGLRPTTNAIRIATGMGFGSAVALLMPLVIRVLVTGADVSGFPVAPVATWRDLPFVYGLLAPVAVILHTTAGGAAAHFLFGTLIVVGYLAMFFAFSFLFATLLARARIPRLDTRAGTAALAIVLQILLTAALWGGHSVVGGVV